MRKNIIIVAFLVIGLAGIGGGIGLGFMLTYPSLEHANNNADYWHNEYNDLYEEYTNLTQDYNDLLADYNSLLSDYNDLFGQYQSILSVLEDPLTNYVIPTLSQVQTWLYYDDTDSFNATDNVWMCGDFSAMLMTRAKEMNWRMRISVMFYSFEGEFYYGDYGEPYGAYGHAFCFIECEDGDDSGSALDLYYIEPQTDCVWHMGSEHVNFDIWSIYNFISMDGTMWDGHRFWTHHYSEFA
jgi:hypothetical protein